MYANFAKLHLIQAESHEATGMSRSKRSYSQLILVNFRYRRVSVDR